MPRPSDQSKSNQLKTIQNPREKRILKAPFLLLVHTVNGVIRNILPENRIHNALVMPSLRINVNGMEREIPKPIREPRSPLPLRRGSIEVVRRSFVLLRVASEFQGCLRRARIELAEHMHAAGNFLHARSPRANVDLT